MHPLHKGKLFSKSAFLFTVVLFMSVVVLYLYNIVHWRNYPDFGLFYRITTGLSIITNVTENGYRAGMRIGDRILEVNGKSFANIQEFRIALNRELGRKNTYLVERAGKTFPIIIMNSPIGVKRAFIWSGPLFLAGFCYLLIGILVFVMKPHQRSSWVFFIFCNILGLFIIFFDRVGKLSPVWLESLEIFGYTFAPAAFIHLAFNFPEERFFLKEYSYLQVLPYLVSTLLFLCILFVTPIMVDTPIPLMIITMAYVTIGVLFFIGSCARLWFRSTSAIVRLRSNMVLTGIGLAAFLPVSDLVIGTLFKFSLVPNPKYYFPFLIIFPLSIGYSIVKYDLFEIDAIIKRTYGYILTTAVVAGTYALFVFLSNLALDRFEVSRSPIFPLIFILAVVFFFNPIRNRLQKLIERIFYRLEYDYQDTVQRISETMRSLLNRDRIVRNILGTALDTLFIDYGCVVLLNREKQVYECLAVKDDRGIAHSSMRSYSLPAEEFLDGKDESRAALSLSGLKIPIDDPLMRKIEERKKELTAYDILEDPSFKADRVFCKKTFDRLEATLIVPLIYERQLIGLISLGNKKSGKLYRRQDINLLNTLANQSTIALENARLLEEILKKERLEEELAIARDLQISMLPAHCPEIEGFTIAALSLPAREVGGDFFDFIEMGKDRIGMVIGDVTGKSVSGALVMAASRSVFRMLSEDGLPIGEIMSRANGRMRKDIKKGMFVALLYAVLDIRGHTLSLCSAGQTQPIYLSSESCRARLLETKGDSFPLGILEEAEYQETQIQLVPGDKVIFYTDGIVEAMNAQQEMFGFERLLEVIQESPPMEADLLLKVIVDKVREFTGNAAQHDDLTLIVLSLAE